MASPKCKICNGANLEKMTVFHKATCPTQSLIEDANLFCLDCLTDEQKEILSNPIKECLKKDCRFYTPVCPAGFYDSDGIDDHTSVWGGAGPDCISGRLATA